MRHRLVLQEGHTSWWTTWKQYRVCHNSLMEAEGVRKREGSQMMPSRANTPESPSRNSRLSGYQRSLWYLIARIMWVLACEVEHSESLFLVQVHPAQQFLSQGSLTPWPSKIRLSPGDPVEAACVLLCQAPPSATSASAFPGSAVCFWIFHAVSSCHF